MPIPAIDKAVADLVDRVRARRREMTVGSARDGLGGIGVQEWRMPARPLSGS
jgi:hypothetical protein